MLRKRTSFKPNLKQVAPQTADQPSTHPAATPAPVDSTPKCPKANPTETQSKVQDAIAQLSQRLDPIRSVNISSANKHVKLKDLLYLNPPMTKDQRKHKKRVREEKSSALKRDESKPEGETISDESEPSLVPKVKMGPEGRLILDESSVIINRKNPIKEQEAIVEDNEDVISRTNYDSFRRRPSSTSQAKWSIDDTNKFYHALTILGTDFSMMESLLFSGQRSRTELHKKFKREERVNKLKIDIALSNRISLDSEELLMCTTPDRSGQALI